MLKIRRFRDRPIFNKEIPIPGKTVFILSLGPDYNLPQKVVGLNMGLVLSVTSAGFLPPVIAFAYKPIGGFSGNLLGPHIM